MEKPETRIADVSVIIPTFNRAEYIVEAIESVLKQTRPPVEIIVVDDGSTDSTPDILKAYGDRIRYIRTENGGKPAAVNLALRHVTGRYVIIADDDDVMFANGLARLLAPLERDPLIDFSSGGIAFFRDIPGRGRIEVAAPKMTIVEVGHHFEAMLMNYSMTHNATLVRQSCYRALGGLDESFSRAEDYDFMLRLTCRFRGVSVPERIINVRQHEGARGDARIRHSALERQLIHFDYGTRAFEKVRRDAPLGSYIGKLDATLSARECFEAWFYRMAAMARHGVWDGFAEDLRECARYRGGANPLITEAMANTLSMIFSRSDTIEARLREPGFPGSVVKKLVGTLGKSSIRPIVRGFYYAARGAYADGSMLLAARCVGFAMATVISGLAVRLWPPRRVK